MLIELPIGWIVMLNVAGWPVIQFGLAWLFTLMPVTWFEPDGSYPPPPRTMDGWTDS